MSDSKENNLVTTQNPHKIPLSASENGRMPVPVNGKNDKGISRENQEVLEKLALTCEKIINDSNHEIADIAIKVKEIAKQENKKIQDVIALISFDGKLKKMSPQHINRLIRNRKFFDDNRPMNGISATVGFLISAPQNEDIAVKLYGQVMDKNLSVESVKTLIAQIRNKKIKVKPKTKTMKILEISNDALQIINFVETILPNAHDALQALTTCCAKLEEDIKNQNAIPGTLAST